MSLLPIGKNTLVYGSGNAGRNIQYEKQKKKQNKTKQNINT